MAPSIDRLTNYGITLHKGDQFKLHDQGAKELKKKHEGRIDVKDGDILKYPGYKNLDVPFYEGTESVWMQKEKAGFQVDVKSDLFSEKIVTK